MPKQNAGALPLFYLGVDELLMSGDADGVLSCIGEALDAHRTSSAVDSSPSPLL